MSIWRAPRTFRRASLWSDLRNGISETRRYGTWSNFSLPRSSGATDSDERWPVTYGINIEAIGSYACTKAIRRPCAFGRERSRTTRVELIAKTYAAFPVMHGRTSGLRHLTIEYGLLRQALIGERQERLQSGARRGRLQTVCRAVGHCQPLAPRPSVRRGGERLLGASYRQVGNYFGLTRFAVTVPVSAKAISLRSNAEKGTLGSNFSLYCVNVKLPWYESSSLSTLTCICTSAKPR